MPLNKNTVSITFAPEQVTNIHINQVNIMKKTILAMTLSAVLSGCNFDNNESASTSDFPVSTIEVTLEKHATLVPVRSGENAESPAYKDVFYNGAYKLCWKDSKHLLNGEHGQCKELSALDSQKESHQLTVYGDATISVQSEESLEGYPEFSDSIHISGKMEYKYGDSLTPILPIKNEHYAAVNVLSRTDNTFPIETAVFGWAEDNYDTLDHKDNVENYEVRRIYFTPTNSKYGLEVKLSQNGEHPLTAELEAPQVGKSYRYEIQESFDSATGITITPTIEDLDSVDQCLGSDCDKPEPTIPEESLSGANIIVEVDGTINATIKEDGKRSEIKTTVESSAPLQDLVLDFNIETELSGSYYALTLVDVNGDVGKSNGLVYVKYATNVELYSSSDDLQPITFSTYDEFVENHGSLRFAQVEDVKAVKPNLIWVSHSDDSEAKAGDSFEVKSFKVLEKVQPILSEDQFGGVTTTVNDDGSVTATVKENALSKNAAGKAFIKVDGELTLNDYDLTFEIDNPKSDLDMGQRHFVNVYLEDSIRADILLQKDPVEVVISDRPNHLSMEEFLGEFGDDKVITWHDGINFNVNFVYRSNGSAINGAGDTFTIRKYATKKDEEI